MKKIAYLFVAVVLIGIGTYRQFAGGGVSDEDRGRCEQIVNATYGDDPETTQTLLPRCDEAGMVAMMDGQATNQSASATASSIAGANQQDITSTAINCALIGAGIGALGAAAVRRPRRGAR